MASFRAVAFRAFHSSAVMAAGAILLTAGCDKSPPTQFSGPSSSNLYEGHLVLDWVPEPEFGGFYAAQLRGGAFEKHGMVIQIISHGAGAPTWQMLASGQTEFAIASADEVVEARAQNADVVAIFAAFQTAPTGVMVHAARHFTSLADVFTNPGTLAAEADPWLTFCEHHYSPLKVTVTSYSGGIAPFLAQPDYSQQCFVSSEPLLAQAAHSDPQTFLVAEAGYNPYTTVVITSGKLLHDQPQIVAKVTDACRAGWAAYLADPKPANDAMHLLNPEMDPATFAAAAGVQAKLIATADTQTHGLGWMDGARWTTLRQQLIDLGAVPADKAPPASDCFVNP